MQQVAGRKRIEFIDLLRGWAVIVMIQTHVFNATLPDAITRTWFFEVLRFVDGLVAPSFLFASGMAYAVTTRRKINDYLAFGPPLFRQLGRLLFVMMIGYGLHIPKFNYYHLRYEAGELAWQVFWQVDVLQCIAISLIFLQVMLLVLRSERRLYMTMIGVTLGVVIATPLVWGVDFWTFVPVPFASYLNGLHYSLFPVFPWSAFLFAGALCGYYYLKAKDAGGGEAMSPVVGRAMKGFAWFGGGVIALSFLVHPLAAMIYPNYDYWRFSPSFFMLRLGLVMFLLVLMFAYERGRGVSPRSVVALMGRESLLVYTVHLMLVYGKYGYFTFADRVHQSFGYAEAVITTIVLIALMYGLALAWARIKAGPPRVKRVTQWAIVGAFAIVFFFFPNY
ncbi:MAG TPA: heparan-alpha-glucosaminide N-acetyltransferase domain-containing protein [Bacteroidota bacterium]|nr:heparan-alpha-glucosaminide N-acetyltransferase domain-containing protein [Bacteroidota bacterium]